MATIHKGTPKKIRGEWGASVPPEARPGDYVEVATKGGKIWIAQITSVARTGSGPVAVTERLDEGEQDAVRANAPHVGHSASHPPTAPSSVSADATLEKEEESRADIRAQVKRQEAEREERRAQAIASMPPVDWTYRDGDAFYAPVTKELAEWYRDNRDRLLGSYRLVDDDTNT